MMANSINIVIILIIVITITIIEVTARPGLLEEYWQKEDRCKLGIGEIIETCQICAKQTKSPIVYPMCCANDDDVYNWCTRFINFGQHA